MQALEHGVFGEVHPVTITGVVEVKPNVYTRQQAAEFGGWNTYIFTGNETAPVAICGRDQYRSRILVLVQVAGVGGFVNIGDLKQFATPGNSRGGRLFNNAAVEIKSQQQYHVLPDGTNPATITVLIERFDAYPDEPIINMGE